MLSKAEIQLIRSLNHKKYRSHYCLFVVEGNKLVREIIALNPGSIHSIYASRDWLESLPHGTTDAVMCRATGPEEMQRISFLKSPQEALALLHQQVPEWNMQDIKGSISLVFDRIQDPGNAGTIIRIAHWFGIRTVICSPDSADIFNPKTIQATMGSFMHVNVFYRDLAVLLAEFTSLNDFCVYGTFPEGENLYGQHLSTRGFIVLGNESKGISPALLPFIGKRLMIPSFSGFPRPDSLNVAMAAAIICSELRRQGNTG